MQREESGTIGGTRKALGYLVGEKHLNYIPAARFRPGLGGECPKGRSRAAADLHGRGAAGVLRDSHAHRRDRTRLDRRAMRDAGAFDEDAVTGATDAMLFERARALLLSGAASSRLIGVSKESENKQIGVYR